MSKLDRVRTFAPGDTVRHLDNREGTLTALLAGALPCAVIQFAHGRPETIALGYLERIPAFMGTGGESARARQ